MSTIITLFNMNYLILIRQVSCHHGTVCPQAVDRRSLLNNSCKCIESAVADS